MDDRKFSIIYTVITAILVLAAFITLKQCTTNKTSTNSTTTDTVTVIDTVYYRTPSPSSTKILYTHAVTLPSPQQQTNATHMGEQPPTAMSVDSDSIKVALPIVQRTYSTNHYTAWVSGYMPTLDSINIYNTTTTVTNTVTNKEKKPPSKWHIGISAGISATPTDKPLNTYIGIGITYSIIDL